jgi:hypothetical protein
LHSGLEEPRRTAARSDQRFVGGDDGMGVSDVEDGRADLTPVLDGFGGARRVFVVHTIRRPL